MMNAASLNRGDRGLESGLIKTLTECGVTEWIATAISKTTGNPVIAGVERRRRELKLAPMNNLKRLILGTISTLLFVTGFARAADHFDPVSRSVSQDEAAISASPDTG